MLGGFDRIFFKPADRIQTSSVARIKVWWGGVHPWIFFLILVKMVCFEAFYFIVLEKMVKNFGGGEYIPVSPSPGYIQNPIS